MQQAREADQSLRLQNLVQKADLLEQGGEFEPEQKKAVSKVSRFR